MDIANCEVCLSGSILNIVPKQNVTPAEVLVLRALHGPESVIYIKLTGSDRRPHKAEYERLASVYGHTENHEGVRVFYKIFPESYDPKLPTTFKEIGVDFSDEIPQAVPNIPDAEDEELPEDDFKKSEGSNELELEAPPAKRRGK
jgi:hypothetical protein